MSGALGVSGVFSIKLGSDRSLGPIFGGQLTDNARQNFHWLKHSAQLQTGKSDSYLTKPDLG